MPQSKNMGRLAEDMKRELIAVIGGMKDPRVQGLVTVLRVELTPDLSVAKVHVSKLGENGAAQDAAAALNRAAGHVRSEIAARMHIRKTPEFRFIADDGARYAAHINEVLGNLNDKQSGEGSDSNSADPTGGAGGQEDSGTKKDEKPAAGVCPAIDSEAFGAGEPQKER